MYTGDLKSLSSTLNTVINAFDLTSILCNMAAAQRTNVQMWCHNAKILCTVTVILFS